MTTKYENITPELLHELFEYRDGELYRKTKSHTRAKIGERVGVITPQGYVQVGIKYRYYSAHRLIFLMHHNYLPDLVDHIDRNRANNRIENLRDATSTVNNQNRSDNKNNTSGVRGVTWHKRDKGWQVVGRANNKYKYLGIFKELNKAKQVIEDFNAKQHTKV